MPALEVQASEGLEQAEGSTVARLLPCGFETDNTYLTPFRLGFV